MPRIKKIVALAVSLALLILLFVFYWKMDAYRDSVDRRETLIAGSIPAHVYLPEVPKPPIVVVAHGFCANKEMMQSLDYSLVRDGFAVVSFDFRGHGQNTTAFDGSRLQEDMEKVFDERANAYALRPEIQGSGHEANRNHGALDGRRRGRELRGPSPGCRCYHPHFRRHRHGHKEASKKPFYHLCRERPAGSSSGGLANAGWRNGGGRATGRRHDLRFLCTRERPPAEHGREDGSYHDPVLS